MSVSVETQPTFRAALPKPLFKVTNLGEYDVAHATGIGAEALRPEPRSAC